MNLKALLIEAATTSRNFNIYSDVSQGCFLFDSEASTESFPGSDFFADALYVRQWVEDMGLGDLESDLDRLLDEVNCDA